jgi:hypothetical protein
METVAWTGEGAIFSKATTLSRGKERNVVVFDEPQTGAAR